LSEKPAVLLIGHGSKQKDFASAMQKVARRLVRSGHFSAVNCAYLEVSAPSIPEGIQALAEKGIREIIIVPYFVLSGKHVANDIPRIVKECRTNHKKTIRIRLSPYLGYHDKLVELVAQRIREAK
jgi:sirohydrochlorin ferrochelatase